MKISKCFLFWISLINLLFLNNLGAQGTYSVRHLKQEDGLPQNSVSNIYFSATGFLWFTTEDGLIRYDGTKIFIFNSIQNSAILNDRFRCIMPSVDGKLYTQTSDGKFFEIKNNRLFPLVKLGDGSIEMRGSFPSKRVFEKFAKQFIIVDTNAFSLAIPYQIFGVNSHQFLILAKENILLCNENGIVTKIALNAKGKPSIFRVKSNVYVGTDDGKVFYVNLLKNRLEPCAVTGMEMHKSRMGVWRFFGTNSLASTFVIDAKNVYSISAKAAVTELVLHTEVSLPMDAERITTIAGNDAGDKFAIGSTNNGIFVYKKSFFTSLDITQNIDNPYYAICKIKEGILSTNQHVFADNKQTAYTLFPKQIGINSLYAHSNFIWFSVNGDLYKFDKTNKKSVLIFKSQLGISCIQGYGDSLWVGNSNQLLYFYKDKLHGSYSFTGQNFYGITLIKRSPTGEIYFSNCIGLYKVLSLKDTQLLVQKEPINACVRDLVFLNDLLFLCTYGNGLMVRQNDVYKKLPLDKNGYLNKSHSLQIDGNNHIWLSTNNGIFETKLPFVIAYLIDTANHVLYNRYDARFGMKSAEFNGGCSPASAMDDAGNIYFPSIQGLVTFNPRLLSQKQSINPIYVDQIYFNRQPVESSDSVIYVGTDVESLKIKLLSAQWMQKAEFEYQLLGYNKQPIRLVNIEDIISFTNLPGGEYLLKIKNMSGLNPNLFPEKQIRIIVEEHFYETAWFQLVLIIIFGSFIFAANQLNNKLLLKRNQALEMSINARTEELRVTNQILSSANNDLMQAVNVKNRLISIISHDIITPIKFMAIAAKNTFKKENKEELSQTLYDIKETANRLHDNAQNVLNWIKYQNNLIEVKNTNVAIYPLAEDICELLHDAASVNNNQIFNEIEPDEIILTDGIILSILLHNLISNAVKYVKNGTIRVCFERKEDAVIIGVVDNGTGMSSANYKRIVSILSKSSEKVFDDSAEGNGLGYVIISELATLLGADVNLVNEPSKGVSVFLTIRQFDSQ